MATGAIAASPALYSRLKTLSFYGVLYKKMGDRLELKNKGRTKLAEFVTDRYGKEKSKLKTFFTIIMTIDNWAVLSPDGGAPAEFAGLRALVVDDCCDDRLLLSVILELHGIQVTAVSSAQEALSTIDQIQPDVLFSDLAMPFQDGYTLIRRVRSLEAGRSLPAIAVSALSPAEEQLASLAAGFQAYVVKPLELQSIAAAIGRVLRPRQIA